MSFKSINAKLQLSVDLVQEWGKIKLPNGKTLSQMFTCDFISFWDLLTVNTALYYVPKALSPSEKKLPHLLRLLRISISACKQAIINQADIYLGKVKVPCRFPKPVCLFLGFQAYFYRDTLEPVVRRMIAEQDMQVVTLCDDSASVRFYQRTDKKVEFQSIWQYWNKDVQNYARNLMSLFSNAVKELKAMKILPQIIKNQGKSLWPEMEDVFDKIFIFYLPYFVKRYCLARQILEHFRPAMIISPDVADPRTQIYCLLGRFMQIPTLEVQFGAYGPESVEWQFVTADRIAVWGETSRDTLLSHKVDAGKIVLTGSPRHDSMVSIDQKEVVRTRAMLGIPDGSVMMLFASSYSSIYDQIETPELVDSVKRAVFQSVSQNDDVRLIVKPHPLEKEKLTKQLAGKHANIIFVDKNDDIKKLIRACDVFISLGTTATLDAIIANKLVICPNFPGWSWSEQFVNSKAVLAPRSEEELSQTIKMAKDVMRRTILADLEPERKRFLQRWMYRVDGEAAARITVLAKQMAGLDGGCK